jgi:hypothetical protein
LDKSFENSKTFWACLSATLGAHLHAPVLCDLAHHPAALSHHYQQCRPPSRWLGGAHPLACVFNPWREAVPRSPVPFCTLKPSTSSTPSLLAPPRATEVIAGKLLTRAGPRRRKHPHSTSLSFVQDPHPESCLTVGSSSHFCHRDTSSPMRLFS